MKLWKCYDQNMKWGPKYFKYIPTDKPTYILEEQYTLEEQT